MTEDSKKTTSEFLDALRGFVINHTSPIFSKLIDLEKRLTELPVPKDGKDADPLVIEILSKKLELLTEQLSSITQKFYELKAAAPKDGIDGREGPPGRDALHLDVLEEIDPERKYQRGTFAKYKGGLIRSFRVTDYINENDLEKSGWTVAVDGIADIALVQGEDIRTFIVGVRTTSGKLFDSIFTMPVVLHKGIFKPHTAYKCGDSVTRDGSMWIALKDIEDSGDSPVPPEWQLSVKRGSDANIKVGEDKKKHPVVRLK